MKVFILCGVILAFTSCASPEKQNDLMKEARTLEMVRWQFNEGIGIEEGKSLAKKLNDFISKQPGFVGRKTAANEEGQFVDLVFWTDLSSARQASEKAMQDPETSAVFATMDQQNMSFGHSDIFNDIQ